MKWGSKEGRKLIEMYEAQGKYDEGPLKSRPEIEESSYFFIWLFRICSATRTHGMGPNPISIREVSDVLDFYGIEGGDFREMCWDMVHLMDHEFLKETHREMESRNESQKRTKNRLGR